MIKKSQKTVCFCVVMLISIVCFTACKKADDYNYQEMLPGQYVVWHWFYDKKDGESGFFDEAVYYNFGDDGKLSITGDAEDFEELTGTYEFTDVAAISISYSDGSFDDMILRYSENHGTIELTNVETLYAVSLEPYEGDSNKSETEAESVQ